MISRKDNEESWLIKHGATVPLNPSGNDRQELETFLSKVLGKYKWYLALNNTLLYIEKESSRQIRDVLRESGCLREN